MVSSAPVPMQRHILLDHMATRTLAVSLPHPTRVAIDGVDAAGKTTLADEVATVLSKITGRQVISASLDRFHNPHEIRYRQGPESPAGYYADSFDLAALRRELLEPLGPGGSRLIRTALFNYRSDTPAPGEVLQAAPDAIILFDGIFLQRPELEDCWDFSIFVQVTFETVLARAIQRDRAQIGGGQAVLDRYRTRYLPAQRRYLTSCRPMERADVVVVNDDPQDPTWQDKG